MTRKLFVTGLILFVISGMQFFLLAYLPHTTTRIIGVSREEASTEPSPEFTMGGLEWPVSELAENRTLEPFRTDFLQNCGGRTGLDAATCVSDSLADRFPNGASLLDFTSPSFELLDHFERHTAGEPGHCLNRSAIVTAELLSVGIPARVVQFAPPMGYGGHTLVEVWQDGQGWLIADPTWGGTLADRSGPISADKLVSTDVVVRWSQSGTPPRPNPGPTTEDLEDLYTHLRRFSIMYPEPWLYVRTGPKAAPWPFRGTYACLKPQPFTLGPAQFLLRAGIALASTLLFLTVVLMGRDLLAESRQHDIRHVASTMLRYLKKSAQGALYQFFKTPLLEEALRWPIASAGFSDRLQKQIARIAPQPYCYKIDDVRDVQRYGAIWSLRPAHNFQWHQLFGLTDHVMHALVALAKNCEVIFDVGANIGFYSVLMAKNAPQAIVHSFEPQPETFTWLERHCQMNAVTNVSCHSLALGKASELRNLYDMGEGDSGKFSLRIADNQHPTTEVRVRSLDELMTELELPCLDLLKIDVEGLEFEVLEGGKTAIERFRPALCFELSPQWLSDDQNRFREGLTWLLELDYSFHYFSDDELQPFDLREYLIGSTCPNPCLEQYNILGLLPGQSPAGL